AVGFIVGMTGVGGGSLMPRIRRFVGIPPTTAVGTDFLCAAVTKSGGVFGHQREGNVNWRLTGLLEVGSLPAAGPTPVVMHQLGFDSKHVNSTIKIALGATLVFTALAIVSKQKLLHWSHSNNAIFTRMAMAQREKATVITGIILGVAVTVTSIGAGAL